MSTERSSRLPAMAVMALVLGVSVAAYAKLRPQHRSVMTDVLAVTQAIQQVESQSRLLIDQCGRANAGIRALRTGDTAKELADMVETMRALDKAVTAAAKAAARVDDGEPEADPALTARPNGDLDH